MKPKAKSKAGRPALPYKSLTKRVPEPLMKTVEVLVDSYKRERTPGFTDNFFWFSQPMDIDFELPMVEILDYIMRERVVPNLTEVLENYWRSEYGMSTVDGDGTKRCIMHYEGEWREGLLSPTGSLSKPDRHDPRDTSEFNPDECVHLMIPTGEYLIGKDRGLQELTPKLKMGIELFERGVNERIKGLYASGAHHRSKRVGRGGR